MSRLDVRKLVVCAGVALLAASCGSSSGSSNGAATSSPSGGKATTLPNVKQTGFTVSGPLTASAPGITPKTIKLGFITSQTGIASSSFKGGDQGALARIALQNAQGGIDGRQIQLVSEDDGVIGNKAAAQDLIENKGVFAIIDVSAFVNTAAPYLNQNGIPVSGSALDGPEWGQQPNSNMFSYSAPVYTPFDGKYYTYDGLVKYLKSIGVTKLATLGYGISPSSIASNKAAIQAAGNLGIKNCYENESVQFGQTSFTTEALAIQKAGCDGVIGTMVDSSDVGLSASLQQAGVVAKQMFYTGYDQSVLDDPNASAALSGSYFPGNFTDPSAAVQGMLSTITKYSPSVTGIPALGVYASYEATDVTIEGLAVAGQNPTRQSFITNLRKVASYNLHGVLPVSITFTGFGTTAMFPTKGCSDYVQMKNGKFIVAARNICGTLVSTNAS